MVTAPEVSVKSRKKLGKRALPEHSQDLRRTLQFAFLVLNLWIGVQFYLFVRYYESGGQSLRAGRPAGVEGWLPIASLMNLKVLLLTGRWPVVHPGRNTSADRVSSGVADLSQELLRLALSRRDGIRISVAIGSAALQAQFPAPSRGGHSPPGHQVRPVGPVRLRRRNHVCGGDPAIFSIALTAWWTT